MDRETGYPSLQSKSSTKELLMTLKKSSISADVCSWSKLIFKQTQHPPWNTAGEIIYNRFKCCHKILTFRHLCKWKWVISSFTISCKSCLYHSNAYLSLFNNKHMDKHDRLYKYLNPDYNKMQDFMYFDKLLCY